ncbi:uncharacterized protein F5891DRAFT_1215820 [Suillus fuscotomentosus]|uniref:Uncharacterized protein n=1 Tax=Suillus fuscotomentosus TaxID=1912939 RepID=A0AAD4DQ39_9AGAM|nr:uncharacterized protein F5891DRAFT_1215820 [Suillus fuscotomentosus]KAG1889060.1 hypothetical protein F5891DRAFT_1215820 [Suillus fuscotomentosus]
MRVHGKDISPPITVLHSNELNSAQCDQSTNLPSFHPPPVIEGVPGWNAYPSPTVLGVGVLSRLWAKHEQEGGEVWGVDIEAERDGTLLATDFKILNPLAAKQWAIKLATEAAVSVLSVDSIIMNKPAGRNPTHTYSILRYLSPTRTLRNRLHAASSKLLFSFVVLAKDQTQFTRLLVDPDFFRHLVSLNIYTIQMRRRFLSFHLADRSSRGPLPVAAAARVTQVQDTEYLLRGYNRSLIAHNCQRSLFAAMLSAKQTHHTAVTAPPRPPLMPVMSLCMDPP